MLHVMELIALISSWFVAIWKYLYRRWRSWDHQGELYLFSQVLDEEDLRYELETYPHRLNYSDDYSRTPLMMAIYLQCPMRTRLFLDMGATLNRKDMVGSLPSSVSSLH